MRYLCIASNIFKEFELGLFNENIKIIINAHISLNSKDIFSLIILINYKDYTIPQYLFSLKIL